MSYDSRKPAAGKPHTTGPASPRPFTVRGRNSVEGAPSDAQKVGARSDHPARGDAGSAVADLVPGTRGAEKPRVFLWEAAASAVRVVGTADAPWFVAKDVCAALGLGSDRVSDAVASLDADEKGSGNVATLGGAQEMLTVNESGLYALIFRSRKEQARVFRKWVTSEVLPAIRKTGGYVAPIVEQPRLAPHIIEVHTRVLPPVELPTEQEIVCCLLAVILGFRRNAVVHGSSIFDAALREDVLTDWVGTHVVEWQRRGRFLHRLRAYCNQWMGSNVVGRFFWVSPHGHGRARRYHLAVRSEEVPQAMIKKTPAPEAVAIVERALALGGEVIVK